MLFGRPEYSRATKLILDKGWFGFSFHRAARDVAIWRPNPTPAQPEFFVEGGQHFGLVTVMPSDGDDASAHDESFSHGLLEYPQYTRPAEFRGLKVPEVLLSGNHAEIARWRRQQSLGRTWQRRPDLIDPDALSKADRALLAAYLAEYAAPAEPLGPASTAGDSPKSEA